MRAARILSFIVVGLILAPAWWGSPAHADIPVSSAVYGVFGGGQFGYSCADAGDVNDDGIPDSIIGAPFDNRDGNEQGRAFIWFGGASIPNLTLQGTLGGERFGWSVCGLLDVNNDGFDDVAVGAPFNNAQGAAKGSVYVFFGGANMNNVADMQMWGETANDNFGWIVCKGNDLNDDGRDDFLVGSPRAKSPSLENGSVYLYLGANGTPSSSFAARFDGEIAGDQFGYAVADVPDYTGSGRAGFIVGAPFNDLTGLDQGRGYLFLAGQNNSLPSTTPISIYTASPGSPTDGHLGWSVSQAGDINGDSRTDVLLGGPGFLQSRGVVAVFHGEATPSSTPSTAMVIQGQTGGDEFGYSVADVGDFKGSSRDDFIVGAPLRDQYAQDAGFIHFFVGGSNYTNASQGEAVTPLNLGTLPLANNFWGQWVSFGGDFDNDSNPDFLTGAPGANNPSDAVTGVVAVVTSSGAAVSIPQVRLEQRIARDDQIQLTFTGSVVDADEASLWTAGTTPRFLAALGQGLTQRPEALVAVFSRADLFDTEQIELRWKRDGHERVDRFELMSIPAVNLRLHEPQPNPFNPSTVIAFDLPHATGYQLRIVDSRGRTVRQLDQAVGGPGRIEVHFDGRDDRGRTLASGVYTVILQAGRHFQTTRAILLK